MESSIATTVLLPVALAVIMFGLGLSLTVKDFARVLAYPRAVLVALGCQIVLLPAACFGLVHLLGLAPELAVGMMLLAASPGGTTANLFSHLAHGDVALNITLTAVNSVLAVVTLPVVVNLSLDYFLGDGAAIGLQFGKTLQVFAIVLIPVVLGLLARSKAPGLAARAGRPVKLLSVIFLVATIAAAVFQERANIAGYLADVGVAAVLFSGLSIAVGYLAPRLFRVGVRQSIAAAMEIGIHNSVLAITVALSPVLLNNPRIAIPAAVYGVVMFGTAGAFGYLISRRVRAPAERPG
ncbi:bile acid:sodium symporter family protein [Amycolatopsis cihanbeyliensis]|uniref:BASS family bile acid:Na+ symporter n=1 Tax=Amycolatopsis cihanbeyliensis TaxID=1128664 RepID=A0A542DE97_AMYCI|nr:bile acid:sodium symporter family protein [Amycolatopsis cihanbeyliensis]TQJ01401.1 BASS family bile acid:Na+ symporter [Amycolatopsis cihanbeyliensis]